MSAMNADHLASFMFPQFRLRRHSLMSSRPFDAKNKEEALARYTELSSSADPQDKLLALGGLVQFLNDVDSAFLPQCAEATDYLFLERLIRNGNSIKLYDAEVGDIKLHSELKEDPANLVQLGCAVLGVFAKVEGMKEKNELLDRIPALVSAFERFGNEAIRTDILESLQLLATVQKGADLILSPQCISTFIETIEKPTYHQSIYHLLAISLRHALPTTNSLPVLEVLSRIFGSTKDPVLITNLLSFFIAQFDTVAPPYSIHLPLYRVIKNLMLSKLDESTRTQTIILLSQILNHLGPTFLFSPPASEDKAKQMALITIRLASVGYQTQSETNTNQQRTIAELNILYITIAWLLSQVNDEDVSIGTERLSPDEILSIQSALSEAVNKVSLYLRSNYDQLLSTGQVVSRDVIDPVVRTSVKVIGAWLMEGSVETDELGVLEVLFALCLIGDIEMTTWAMRGIRGMILFTEEGETELMTHKEQFPKLLAEVVDNIGSNDEDVLVMVKEICIVFRILVQNQPLMMTQRSIRNFPEKMFGVFEVSVEEVRCAAQTEAVFLALEILLNLVEAEGEESGRELRDIIGKWIVRGKELLRVQRDEDAKEAVLALVSSLEEFV